MIRRKAKATNVVSLAEYRQRGDVAAPQQGGPRTMEKARIIAQLATAWGVDLRLAAAIQRGDAGVTPGAG